MACERSSDGRPLFGLPPYPFVLAGTVLVGLAQPFFQCTPPLLSATWFASDERATSSAVALNFNQVGIAAALVVGGKMVDNGGGGVGGDGDAGISSSRRDDDDDDDGRYRVDDHGDGVRRGDQAAGGGDDDDDDDDGLARYFALVAVLSAFLCAGTCRYFRDSPPVPPSASEAGKAAGSSSRGAMPFHVSVRGFFGKRGFGRPLAAFVFSIAITNVVGAFIEESSPSSLFSWGVGGGGVGGRWEETWAGCGFEMAIVLGGVILGRYVDRTKEYKSVTMWCIMLSLIFVLPLGLTQHRLGQEPKLLVASLFLLGFFVGPVQPINSLSLALML
ncbi:hypothetical protein ACHAW5_005584 [Stephanodiscus triporus]|uniref:Solute carrier family 40 protein n=1 Tax=Stephanodiscus triporus TaxID=2934178 RepID=A0ABD3PXP8_9STRA